MRRWFQALAVMGFLTEWFTRASRDGVLSAVEIAEAVSMLISMMGYDGKIKVDPAIMPNDDDTQIGGGL